MALSLVKEEVFFLKKKKAWDIFTEKSIKICFAPCLAPLETFLRAILHFTSPVARGRWFYLVLSYADLNLFRNY